MSTLTDRYCPHCFRQLNEGVKDWLWCPDTYICEYECDISKQDTTIDYSEMLLLKRKKLEAEFIETKEQYERDLANIEQQIKSITNKINET